MQLNSLSQAELERVVVELGGVLTIWLCHALSSKATALIEHFWEVISFVVDLHFAQGHGFAVLEVVRVDDCFDFLLLLVNHVVCSGEIALFKRVLGGSMTEEQV